MSASTQEERTEIEVRRMIAVPANLLTMEPCNTPNLLSSHLAPCWHPMGGNSAFVSKWTVASRAHIARAERTDENTYYKRDKRAGARAVQLT